MAAKKKDWAELLGGPSKGGDDTGGGEQPDVPPTTVFMHTIVGNPDNPRPEDDYSEADPEFAELKASMREIGQLQPLAVVSRTVYEQAKPDAVAKAPAKTRKLLRDAEWVVVTGNRRLAAARQLGWTRIDIRVQDQLGDEDGRIDEAVIIENIHRKNLAPIREAEYLAGMVERHGSQEKVAERIGKTQVYVSQRLALLKLAPDLQQQVDTGELKLKPARQIAGKSQDHDQQRQLAAQVQQQRAEPKPEPAAPAATPQPAAEPVQNRVLNGADLGGRAQQNGQVQNPVLKPAPVPDAPPTVEAEDRQVPEPRAEPAEPDQVLPEGRVLPYDNGVVVAWHLIRRMPVDAFTEMLRVMNKNAAERGLNVAPEHAS